MKKRRNTIAKRAILSLITESELALSHTEIQSALNNLCDRVTTYRVLERLISEGLIHKVLSVDGIIRYAACHNCSSEKHSHNHIHFSCVKCRTISCLDEVKPKFSLPDSYRVSEVNVTVSGLCPGCSEKADAAGGEL